MSAAIALLLWVLMLPQFTFAQAAEPTTPRTAGDFVASGDRYFAKGDYRSATVEYQNAIRSDKKFEPAHAKLGFTFLKLGNWNLGYRELNLATAENPDDLEAQMALLRFMVAASQYHRALGIANTILAKDPKNVEARTLRITAKRAIESWKAETPGRRPVN